MNPTASIEEACQRRLREFDDSGASRRLWQKDGSLWKSGPTPELVDRLGWLTLPETMAPRLARYKALAEDLRRRPVEELVLLGMGGSSLAPELMQAVFGNAGGFPRLTVLDTTSPATVDSLRRRLALERSAFIVSSKSGSTIETACLCDYFWAEASRELGPRAASRFIAITDPASPFERQARERGFGAIESSPSDVGGRYSALSPFGLLPAALIGVDCERLLASARAMARACGPHQKPSSNPAFRLGVWLGEAALAGKDKLTLLLPPPLASFGAWLEQLIAESTGKEGLGILPVEGEDLLTPDRYGGDRVFVRIRLAEAEDANIEEAAEKISASGLPIETLELDSTWDLGGEFLRWEIATAAACMVLKVNPFDQPNVEESKALTRALLGGTVPVPEPAPPAEQAAERIRTLEEALEPGDYLAITAFLQGSAQEKEALARLRRRLQRKGNATTLGFGPRFLHSTGQLHKGGGNSGVFLQLTGSSGLDVPVPQRPFTFGALQRAQAEGDFQALRRRGRRVARLELGERPAQAIEGILELL